MEVLFLAMAILTGWQFVQLAGPADKTAPRWASSLFEFALGAGGGIAIVSFLFFLELLFHVASSQVMLVSEAVLLLTAASLRLVRRSSATRASDRQGPVFWWYCVLGGALIISIAAVTAASVKLAQADLYGRWDAIAMWNLRAKYLAGPGDTWRHAFSPLLGPTHPDYPLLTSGFIGHLWKFSGRETSTLAPILTAAVFAVCVVALLISGLAVLRSTGSALLAGLILMTSTSFLKEPMSQYADIPLSFYYLATLILVLLSVASERSPRPALALMAGAFSSFAAWTKNEGMAFFFLSWVCYTFVFWRPKHAWASSAPGRYFLLGAIPGLLIVGYFKLFMAPPNDLTNQTAAEAMHKLVELDRYLTIAKSLISEAVFGLGNSWTHPLLLLAILALVLGFGVNQRQTQGVSAAALTLGLLGATYVGVYVLSPHDLRVHLATSEDRLYVQVWPSFLFVAFLILAPPEERLFLANAKH